MKIIGRLKFSIERKKLLLLIALTFCTGIFLSNYFTFSNGLFLNHFDHSWLPIAYIISGLTGLLLTKVYATARLRMHTKALLASTLGFIAVCAFIIGALYHLEIQQRALIFTSFAFLSSFYTLVGLQLWGIAFHLFDVRTSKKVFAKLGSGGVIASLCGFILAGQLATHYSNNPESMLLVGCIALVVALLVQQVILHNYFHKGSLTKDAETKQPMKSLFSVRMVVLLFSMMLVSVFLQYLIDYNFLKGTRLLVELRRANSSAEESMNLNLLPIVFAYTFAGIKMVELIMRFASFQVFKNIGMGKVLLILPLLFAGLHSFLIITDLVVDPHTYEGFKVLFVFFLLSKIADRSLRGALDDPARKMLYQPLPAKVRKAAQVYIDGYAKQFAILLGGVFLLLLNLSPATYWQIGLLVVLLSSLWFALAFACRSSYTKLLEDFLKGNSGHLKKSTSSKSPEEQYLGSLEKDVRKLITTRDRQLLQVHIEGKPQADLELESLLTRLFLRLRDSELQLKVITLGHKYQLNKFLEEAFFIGRFNKKITIAILPYFATDGFRYNEGQHGFMFETVLQKCLRNLVWLRNLATDFKEGGKDYEELRREIEKEIEEKYVILFEILAIKKDRRDIMTLRDHLMDERPSDSRLFAIELFEMIFQDEDEKSLIEVLLSIFEDDQHRIRQHFVIYKANAFDRLEELFYADLFKVTMETKRLAFQLICKRHTRLFANLIEGSENHPDLPIRRLARKQLAINLQYQNS